MKTLFDYQTQVTYQKGMLFAASLAFAGQQLLDDMHNYDMWNLTLVLGTSLAYLYTRDVTAVIIIFVAFFFLEIFACWVVAKFLCINGCKLDDTHTNAMVLLTDPLVAGLSLLTVYFILEGTAIGNAGAGGSIEIGRAEQETWRTFVVLLAVFFTGFAKLYWTTFLALIGVVWTSYAIDSTGTSERVLYSLWLASRASLFILFYMLAFLRPIHKTYLSNAFVALLSATWFASLIQFGIEQQ